MTKLSVNVNKFATLRNARGKNNPDVLKMALLCIEYGAQGITVHPRPDERHIRKSDVLKISKSIQVEFNIEGYPSEDYLNLVEEVRPAQATLVPDPPEAITSNAGWNVEEHERFLTGVVKRLKNVGVRTSLFIDPLDQKDSTIPTLMRIGTDRIELYTEDYAVSFSGPKREASLSRYVKLAASAQKAGIGINAGHDLDLENLSLFVKTVPAVEEVSIGHALVCDALVYGLETTVKKYLDCLRVKN